MPIAQPNLSVIVWAFGLKAQACEKRGVSLLEKWDHKQ